jgi:hypothetical protein
VRRSWVEALDGHFGGDDDGHGVDGHGGVVAGGGVVGDGSGGFEGFIEGGSAWEDTGGEGLHAIEEHEEDDGEGDRGKGPRAADEARPLKPRGDAPCKDGRSPTRSQSWSSSGGSADGSDGGGLTATSSRRRSLGGLSSSSGGSFSGGSSSEGSSGSSFSGGSSSEGSSGSSGSGGSGGSDGSFSGGSSGGGESGHRISRGERAGLSLSHGPRPTAVACAPDESRYLPEPDERKAEAARLANQKKVATWKRAEAAKVRRELLARAVAAGQ